jgi:hypothetical protein
LSDGKKYSEVVDADLALITPKVITQYSQFLANLYSWTGYESSIFVDGIGTFATEKAIGMGEAVKKGGRPRIYLSLSHMVPAVNRQVMGVHVKSGEYANMSTVVVWSAGSNSGGSGITVRVFGIHRALTWIYSRTWWFVYCETAVRARIPVIVGLIATGVLHMKIWTILTH